MKNRYWVLLLLGITGLALTVVGGRQAAPRVGDGSSLANGPQGWRAARMYVEAAGGRTEVLRRRLAETVEGRPPLLVTVQPWTPPTSDLLPGIQARLAAGGTVLVGYGAEDPLEPTLMSAFGVERRRIPRDWPWAPLAWWREASREVDLAPAPGIPGPGLRLRLPETRLEPPPEARVLYGRRASPEPQVFELRPRGGGRLVFLPAEVLANGRLRENVHLLDQLLAAEEWDWEFDEVRHGLLETPAAARSASGLGPLLAQLLLVYGVVLATLARRFGAPREEEAARTAPVARFLLGVGRLHDRLGHHRQAARRLGAVRAELDPRGPTPDARGEAEQVAGGEGLAALARRWTPPRAAATVPGRQEGGR